MKVVKIFFFLVILSGCAGSKVLPRYDSMNYNYYGAQIKAKDQFGNELMGELIAANDSGIWVLRNFDDLKMVSWGFENHQENLVDIDSRHFYFMHLQDLQTYRVKYARSRNYAKMMLLTPVTFFHGLISLISFPINLIVTGSVAISGSIAYQYNELEIPKSDLFKFARYPSGLPKGLNPQMLSNNVFSTTMSSPWQMARDAKNQTTPKGKGPKRGDLE